jgi:hypothetical protein
MATNKWRHKSDLTVGENESSPTKVPGRPAVKYKTGGENLTPSPTKQVDTLALARSTSWGHSLGDPGDNPGKNGFGGASSVNPGERAGPATVSPQAPTDNVLEGLIRGGVRALDTGDDWQTRNAAYADPKPFPSAHGQAKRGVDSGSPGGTIPAKNGNPTSDWDARRAQQLKQAK